MCKVSLLTWHADCVCSEVTLPLYICVKNHEMSVELKLVIISHIFLHNHYFLKSKVDPEQVALLVKHEWKLAYVTPLYRFRHSQLKLYSKHLAAFIVAEKQQGVAVEVGPEAGLKVTITTIPGLAETEGDAETIFIQVKIMFVCAHHSISILETQTVTGVCLFFPLSAVEFSHLSGLKVWLFFCNSSASCYSNHRFISTVLCYRFYNNDLHIDLYSGWST